MYMGRDVVVATGMAWRDGKHRVGVFAVGDGAPALLEDVWVDDAGEAALVARYRDGGDAVRVGWWDAWAQGGWSWVWTDDRGPFRSWTRAGASWRCAGDGLVTADGAHVPIASLRAIVLEVEAGWEERWLRLEGPEPAVVVFHERSSMPSIDPTYDGISLDEDVSVMRIFGAALGRATGVPYRQVIG
jgi:hypothetical protein